MTRYSHGLVVGKFYPPHAGHHYLIRTAARQCDKVSVIVAASQVESIPLVDRVAWLREEHAADRNVVIVGVLDDAPSTTTARRRGPLTPRFSMPHCVAPAMTGSTRCSPARSTEMS